MKVSFVIPRYVENSVFLFIYVSLIYEERYSIRLSDHHKSPHY
jgi:hypothetical protein